MRKLTENPLLSKIFGIDFRTLALFRVVLGVAFLYDWFIRVSNVIEYYTDSGVLPRSLLLRATPISQWYIDLHLLNGIAQMQYLLFAISGLSALAMIVGYRTSFATCLTWLLLISAQNRNPLILHAGDVVLRMYFFWAMFLPLGARYSFDSIRSNARRLAASKAEASRVPHSARTKVGAEVGATETKEPAQRAISFATTGALLQVCFIYWFAAILKSDISWHNGTAIYLSLLFDQLARPFGIYLLQWPNVLREMTYATYALERLGPVLALFPFWRGRIRMAMVICFVLFHLSLAVCLYLGMFLFSSWAGWMLFVPSETWDSLEKWYHAKPRVRLKQPLGAVADAVRRAGAWLPGPTMEPCGSGPSGTLQLAGRWTSQGLAGFFIVYIFLWNLRTIDFDRYVKIFPVGMNWIAQVARLDQMWNMFAPPPTKTDGWYVIPAQLRSGLEVDLLTNGQPVTWAKPQYVVYTNKDERHQKWMINLPTDEPEIRQAYAEYLSREWNSRHIETMHIATMQIYFMNEPTLPDHNPAKPVKQLLGNYVFPE